MKKFFGLTVLLVAALFVSCNFNNSNQKGSVDFTIPVGEIIALRNEIQEEPVTEKEDPDFSDEPKIGNEYGETFGFLVQLKGNKGYHQIRYEYLEDTRREDLEEASFHFSFDKLPVNQQYKVMIDVFVEGQNPGGDEKEGHALLIFSGDKDNIIVSAGETTREELELDYADEWSYSNFDIEVKYKEGNDIKSDTFKLDSPENIPLVFARNEKTANDVTSWTYYFREKNEKELEEDSDISTDYENQDSEAWNELVYLGFKLRDDSHYDGFNFVGHKEIDDEKDDSSTTEEIKFVFDHENTCAVLDYLEDNNYPFNFPLYAEVSSKGSTIKSSMWFPLISVSTISFAEKEEEEKGEGTLTLSIPGIELENSDATAGAGSTDMMYTYLVQVRCMSSSYYAVKTKTVNAQALKESQAFTFEGIVPGKNYQAMVDIFSQGGKAESTSATGNYHLTYAGDETVLISGDTTSVEVKALPSSENSYSNFSLFLTYEEDGSTYPYGRELETSEGFSALFAKCKVGTGKTEEYKYYCRQKKSADEEIPQFGFTDENPDDWTEIKDFYFGLKEDSHYRKFTFVQPIQNDNEEETIDIVFDDNNLFKVTDYLEGNNFIFNYPLSATLTFDDGSTFDVSLWTPQVRFADITFAQQSFTETQFGEITIQESKLTFEPWKPQVGVSVRYMSTIALDTILGGKHLSDGDTVVFVLEAELGDNDDIFAQKKVSQFYYQLQPDDWLENYTNDTDLFAKNNCITFVGEDCSESNDSGETLNNLMKYTFVMPLNQIEDAVEYNNLQLFFDYPAVRDLDSIESSLEMACSITYSIFPKEQNAFVFGVGSNYGNASYPYRYEFKLPLKENNQACVFEGGETVEVTLSGEVFLYQNNNGTLTETAFSTTTDKTLDGEIFDGGDYVSKESSWGRYFHPLCNTEDKDAKNILSLELVNGNFSEGSTYKFEKIQRPLFDLAEGVSLPDNFEHNYQFQCKIPCENQSDLLVIKNFSMETTVTPAD